MIYEEVKAAGRYVVLKGEIAEDKTEVKTESGIILQGNTASANSSGQKVNTINGEMEVMDTITVK